MKPSIYVEGALYAPTVLADLPGGSRIEREEIFGPAITVANMDNKHGAVLYETSARAKAAAAWRHRRGLVAMVGRYRR